MFAVIIKSYIQSIRVCVHTKPVTFVCLTAWGGFWVYCYVGSPICFKTFRTESIFITISVLINSVVSSSVFINCWILNYILHIEPNTNNFAIKRDWSHGWSSCTFSGHNIVDVQRVGCWGNDICSVRGNVRAVVIIYTTIALLKPGASNALFIKVKRTSC